LKYVHLFLATALDRLRLGTKITRAMGPNWVLYRLWYAAQKKSGYFRWRTPARPWEKLPLSRWLRTEVPSEPHAYADWRKSQPVSFFFRSTSDFASVLQSRFSPAVAKAESIIAGHWRYFSGPTFSVGCPPEWHKNPLTGEQVSSSRHWSELADFKYGDIKLVWEASRFSVVYPLARAYAWTGDERYVQVFWQLLEDWARYNPPNRGPNWMSGQELAFRLMAWCFALYEFDRSPHSNPERVAKLVAMIATHAERIEATLKYARSQKNNHALSEATGLLTVGLLFPELRKARHWRTVGRSVLEAEVRRQIYDDGSYVQHSVQYHRVMLQVLLWALRLSEIHGRPLSAELGERFRRATDFLDALTDPHTGRAPNLGSNDGTLVLPLNECEYDDFRPVIQACHFALSRNRRYEPGLWDEDLLWLFGPQAVEYTTGSMGSTKTRSSNDYSPPPLSENLVREFPIGGTYLLGEWPQQAFLRCVHYRDRPGQADQLHLDLWRDGINIARDAGTFLYSGPPPWDNSLAQSRVHNTLTLDGRNQMNRGGRFLWVDWARGWLRHQARTPDNRLEFIEGQHDGYRAMHALHRRAVLRVGCEGWLVVDDMVGPGVHRTRLHWLLADLPFEYDQTSGEVRFQVGQNKLIIRMWASCAGNTSLVRGGISLMGTDELAELRGWVSKTYAEKERALSLALDASGQLPIRFITYVGVAPAGIERLELRNVAIQLPLGKLSAQLAEPGASPIFSHSAMHGKGRSIELSGQEAREPRQIHTLLIHQSFVSPTEAGGTRHYELARRLVRRGHQFTIVASDMSYLTGKPVTETRRLVGERWLDGVRIFRTWCYAAFHRSYLSRVLAFLSFSVISVPAAWRAGQVDILMGTTPPIFQAVSAWFVALLRRRPFLLEVRDLWPDFAIEVGVIKNPLLIWLSRWLERFLYNRATHILVNSPAYQTYLTGRGVPPEKVTLIANGVDPTMFDPNARGSRFKTGYGLDQKFVALYAGALGLANDLDTLIEAAVLLREESSIHFLLVGDGKERQRLEAEVRLRKLPNITFAGAQPKTAMPEALAAADACIAILKDVPMFRTTYPNKVFDYMAAGRPVVLAIDGVIREVIEAAGCGIYVPPGNSVALAEAIRQLSRDPARSRTMGLLGRVYVQEHFHRDKQAEQLAELVEKLAR
jgi:glycosyltransferase involved in cell wall biosynthesis